MDNSSAVNGDSSGRHGHILVVDQMRTRSHLFWRWISTHPKLYSSYHPYLESSYAGPERCLTKLRSSDARTAENAMMPQVFPSEWTYEAANHALEGELRKAEKEGKIVFTNEHTIDMVNHYILVDVARRLDAAFPSFEYAFPNPTYIPDRLMEQFTPVILVRHPILMITSLYTGMTANTQCRPGDEDWTVVSSFEFSRLMFEYFRLARGRPPIVIDGEDILWRTKELGDKFCKAVGIDPKGLSETWERLPDKWWAKNDFIYAMTKTLHESTGIERPAVKPEEPNLERAVEDWTKRWGAEVAQQLKERTEQNMPHYERIVQYKI